ncbi:MAG: cupin domain-containing protein [Gammaproteobacteria bacterium]|nr:cupin domain-containing protein [Gammaproteobacteria bacterium]
MSVTICFFAMSLSAQETSVTPLFQTDLDDIEGREGLMVIVDYPPGVSSAAHRHNAHTFVFVLEGSVVMQVEGEERVVLGPGQIFYETPEDIHAVSMNASTTEPAKILVFFVKHQGAPVTVPAG